MHPLEGDELRALRRLRTENPDAEFVFLSERRARFTTVAVRKMLHRLAADAGMGALKVHPHALRHATGYAFANKGVDTRTLQSFMGHAQIGNTVRYTVLGAGRFKGLWRK